MTELRRLIRPLQLNEISGEIVDAALRVHSAFGPGLLESPYRDCLAYELRARGLTAETEVPVPIVYREFHVKVAYRIDLLVEHAVVVETKSVSKLLRIHRAQNPLSPEARASSRGVVDQLQCRSAPRRHRALRDRSIGSPPWPPCPLWLTTMQFILKGMPGLPRSYPLRWLVCPSDTP